MKRSTRITVAISAIVLICLAAIEPASATAFQRLSVVQMAQAAGAIVRARCVGSSSRWQAGEIWTFATFDVEETWKGATNSKFQVRLLGGSVGDLTSTVSGVPHFQASERVILFLEPTSLGDFGIVSWAQGTFRIHRSQRDSQEIVTQDTAAFAAFDPRLRSFTSLGARDVPLETFRAQVIAALRDRAGETR